MHYSQCELVDLDQDLMPDAFVLKNRQAFVIDLLHLPSSRVRRQSRSVQVFLSVRMPSDPGVGRGISRKVRGGSDGCVDGVGSGVLAR